MICTWEGNKDLERKLQSHEFQHLLINDGQKTLLIKPKVAEINIEKLIFLLPGEFTELNSRKIRRYSCSNISANLIQNGSSFQGTLVEFSATSLHIKVQSSPPQTFQWLNNESPATLVLSNQAEAIYSTECNILKQSCGQHMRSIVLAPTSDRIFKFKPKKHRSTRNRLKPSPSINFRHPLTKGWIDLDVDDISGSGLSVTENVKDSTLLPGMIIQDLALVFANSDSLRCKAQVVYRIPPEDSSLQDTVKCGIAFLDMKIEEQTRLLGMLYQAENKHSYLSNRVDLDSLWKFFFDSGFIYPEKYLHLKSNKNTFKNTYRTLYEKKPNIARHFVYQSNGNILAHMSMVRFYNNAWLVQHHASRKTETRRGGLTVLSNASRYANDTYHLYSAHLDFLFCYFRSNNRFPRRIFGGATKYIDDPKGCSIDSFAYFHFNKSFNESWQSANHWSFNSTNTEDLQELKRFIDYSSGGLMIPALDLDSICQNESQLFREYRELGMVREQHLFSIKVKGTLKAVIVLNLSESFLNMSDLTNCFKIIVIDSVGLTREILFLMLSILCVKFGLDKIPALLYPSNIAEEMAIPIEKIYNLWILNMQHMDRYFDFCEKVIPGFGITPS
ncbi:hypothetical protein A7E78_06695 [Syntrophotalea acetylenivorans]|uniref:PilZ domain-containing protein n=1 Tax=Syntrophotalea acetylenivorans TaxID=1842532 RepID=A0A1L3GNQ4_9BACT|nr:hypothetical protein A7E78_06695 [Syntrophotalea acetylenivorans]